MFNDLNNILDEKSRNYLVRIYEVCQHKDYKLLGVSESIIKSSSKLVLYCNICNHTWDTCTVSHFLGKDGNGCTSCKKKSIAKARTKNDSEMIEKFMSSGLHLPGTRFWRSSKKHCWDFTCVKCSSDDYVQNGLCSGVFTASSNNICINKSCRCSKTYNWTQEQRELQIKKKLLDHKKITFIKWLSEFKGNKSRILLSCEDHAEWDVNINNFLGTLDTGCPSCAKYGFDRTKESQIYVLQITGDSGDFTGYGISADAEYRIKEHKRNLLKSGYYIDDFEVFYCSGIAALEIESAIKTTFPLLSQKVNGFIKEATHNYLYQDVIDFVENRLTSTENRSNMEVVQQSEDQK